MAELISNGKLSRNDKKSASALLESAEKLTVLAKHFAVIHNRREKDEDLDNVNAMAFKIQLDVAHPDNIDYRRIADQLHQHLREQEASTLQQLQACSSIDQVNTLLLPSENLQKCEAVGQMNHPSDFPPVK